MSTIEGVNPSISGSTSKKRPRRTSEVWKHFDESPNEEIAICKYCRNSFSSTRNAGTSHLKRHIETCKQLPSAEVLNTHIFVEEKRRLKENYERELKDLRALLSNKTEEVAMLEKELKKKKVNAVPTIKSVQEMAQQKLQQKEKESRKQQENVHKRPKAELCFAEGIAEANLHDKYVNVASLREYDRIINMTFSSENEAFEFFNNYAKRKGFSVRRSIVMKDLTKTTITYRQFYCSRQGFREQKHLYKHNRKRPAMPITRCGCPVKFCVKLDRKTSRWWVKNFIDDHNHGLATPDGTPFLRSHCTMNEAQKFEISSMRASGIRNYQILDYVAQCSGGYENRGYQEKNLYNFSLGQEQSTMLTDDADSIVRYFEKRKESNPDFFFKYDTKDGRLNRLFWADGQSVIDYVYFGDVVIFDSTYQLNRYNMIVVPFLGCNHHRSTIIFACGIVSCENDATYKWLLEAFLEAMYQARPESVITDGDLAMGKAIKSILKETTTHRICSWHMERNAKKYIYHSTVLQKFHELVRATCSPEEFEEKWKDFEDKVTKRSLGRQWLQTIYKTKQSWAGAFVNKKMFLGMSSTQRSEGLNARLHSYINGKMSLSMAIQQFERCLTRMRTKEAELDCKASQTEPVLQTSFPDLESSAASNYTPSVFRIVREELERATGLVVKERISDSMSSQYLVAREEKVESQYIVYCSTLEDSIEKLSCTCAKLECEKILCRHIFAVLIHLKATCIPQCCIRDRWTKCVKSGFPSDRKGGAFKVCSYTQRYHELNKTASLIHCVVAKSPSAYLKKMELLKEELRQFEHNDNFAEKSEVKQDAKDDVTSLLRICNPKPVVTKGAPKKNKKAYERIKSAIESKRKNKCGHCGQRGHNRQTCQLHQNHVAASTEGLVHEPRDDISGP